MTAIINKQTRITNADNFIESFTELSSDRYYLGIGRSEPWDNEPTPDIPVNNDATLIDAWNNILGMKAVASVNVIPVVKNSVWESGKIYSAYDHEADSLFPIVGVNIYPTYTITSAGRVYKCIYTPDINGVFQPSTVVPSSTSTDIFETADGYKWKYMLNVDLAGFCDFATEEYFPVAAKLEVDNSTDQWLVQQAAKDGSIDRIEVLDGGADYADGDVVTVVSATGTGFVGTVKTVNSPLDGTIKSIEIDYLLGENGLGYRDVSAINVASVNGVGADLRAILSPIGGHGSDAREELGGTYVMVKCMLESDESGKLPVGDDFRQVFLLKNPKSTELGMKLILGGYNVDAPLSVGTIIENGLALQSTVVSWDAFTGVLYVSGQTTGYSAGQDVYVDANIIATIISATDDAPLPATATAYEKTEIVHGSGKLVYIENREPLQRNLNQSEDIRLVIEF